MNTKLRSVLSGWTLATTISVVTLTGAICYAADDSPVDASERAMAKAREKDPAWKPSHKTKSVIQIGKKGQGGNVHSFCVNTDGNLLVCCGGVRWIEDASGDDSKRKKVEEPSVIKVYTPDGKMLTEWKMESEPEVITQVGGVIYVAGDGKIMKLDKEGKVIASVESPVLSKKIELSSTFVEDLKSNKMSDAEIEKYKGYLETRKKSITGIAVSGQDVFVACPSPSDFSFTVYRLNSNLRNPVLIVDGLRGCCGQMDIQARDGKLWIAHNARHQVESHDRDGKLMTKFGKMDRKEADGFGGCCEPKNMRFTSKGDIFVAESGPPVTVKRFSAKGKFLGVIGLPGWNSGCVRVTVDCSLNGKNFYVLNSGDDSIHVLTPK